MRDLGKRSVIRRIDLPVAILLCSMIFSSHSAATIRNVPGVYPTIQEAINASSNGDTVLIANGTYSGVNNKNLSLYGKSITVRSENGPTNCIIDCQDVGRGFYFSHDETPDSIVKGITIFDGHAPNDVSYGGGIYCETGCSPTIVQCVIDNCYAEGSGGGIYCEYNALPLIYGNILTNNATLGSGGALFAISAVQIIGCYIQYNEALGSKVVGQGGGVLLQGTGLISDCVILSNAADRGGGVFLSGNSQVFNCLFIGNSAYGVGSDRDGGAVYCNGGSASIWNCTFQGNNAAVDGYSLCTQNAEPTIKNCIIWDSASAGICVIGTGGPLISYSDVMRTSGVWPGTYNINIDPVFVTGPNGQYYLSNVSAGQALNSPCINFGSTNANSICYSGYADPDAPAQVCLSIRTTRTDEILDAGTVDLGYHHYSSLPTPTSTPTSIPTSTRTPTRTPTSIPTSTPTFTPTAPTGVPTYTPHPTNTPSPTPSPECLVLGCTVFMPSDYFGPGDDCYCDVVVCNPTSETYPMTPVFVILDVYGTYFFAPSFGDFDHYTYDIVPGHFTISVLPSFAWPTGAGSAAGLNWFAAMTDQSISSLLGNLGVFPFGWHE